MGNLEKIWLKRAKLGVMDEVLKAEMEAGVGLVKNLEKNIFRKTLIEKEEVLMKSLSIIKSSNCKARREQK